MYRGIFERFAAGDGRLAADAQGVLPGATRALVVIEYEIKVRALGLSLEEQRIARWRRIRGGAQP